MRVDCSFRSTEDFRGKILEPLPRGSGIVLFEDWREHLRMSFFVRRFAFGLAAHLAGVPYALPVYQTLGAIGMVVNGFCFAAERTRKMHGEVLS